MHDDVSPIAQFHPYRKPADVPVALRPPGAADRLLRGVGADPARLRFAVDRGRSWARSHPGRLLGGLALAVIGAGLARSRMHRNSP
ncbi:MAG: hypothetical protein ACRD2J_06265 [Thermoanaerobaculia bacterium]